MCQGVLSEQKKIREEDEDKKSRAAGLPDVAEFSGVCQKPTARWRQKIQPLSQGLF